MPCQNEKQIYDQALNYLRLLWDDLRNARNPEERAALIKEIEQQRQIVERAESNYNKCKAKLNSQVINMDGQIEINYSGFLVGDKSAKEAFSNSMTFTGDSQLKVLSLKSFQIKKNAIITVNPWDGSFDPSTGVLSLPAHLIITFAGITGDTNLSFTTDFAETPSKKYSGRGVPLNQESKEFIMVAAGAVFGFEYFVKVTAKLDRIPA